MGIWSLLFLFVFESLAYHGRVLVVHKNQAVIEVDPKKAKVGDQLMFYDKFLVQQGIAKIAKFGRKKSRALVKVPEGMVIEKGFTVELLESIGPAQNEIDQTELLKICYEQKKRESNKPQPVAETWELWVDGQSLKATQSDDRTLVTGALRMSYLFVPGFQFSLAAEKTETTGRVGLGVVINIPVAERSLPRGLFLGGYFGQLSIQGDDEAYAYSEVLLGQRVILFERLSWTPYIAQKMVSELEQEEVQLSLLSFSLFWP